MNIKVEKLENNFVKIEVTVSVEKFQAAIKKAYSKNSGKFSVPGFRKGKTPLPIIEKYYGDSVFYEDAINFVCDETYPDAISANNISPVDYPEIDIVQIGKDVELIYTAKIMVKPEVTLGEYKGIEVKKSVYIVTDEDIDTELDSMRNKNARMVSKEDTKVENGSIAVIDFEGFVDDVAFEGGKGENYELTIGSGSFIPGFEDQLIGLGVNETKDVKVNFPEEYQAEELKGKAATFIVKVNEIKTKELPVLDDEFVKDVSEFDTLEDLKNDIKRKQEENNKAKAKKEYEEELLNKVIAGAKVDVPQVMIEREIDYFIKDLEYRLNYQHLNLEKYIELMGTSMEAVRSDFNENATNKVKMNLVLEAIAKAENFTATDEEIVSRVEEIAKTYGSKDIEKMKESILKSEKSIIKEEVVNNKVVDFLVNESKSVA